jgi:hypothetical protein
MDQLKVENYHFLDCSKQDKVMKSSRMAITLAETDDAKGWHEGSEQSFFCKPKTFKDTSL